VTCALPVAEAVGGGGVRFIGTHHLLGLIVIRGHVRRRLTLATTAPGFGPVSGGRSRRGGFVVALLMNNGPSRTQGRPGILTRDRAPARWRPTSEEGLFGGDPVAAREPLRAAPYLAQHPVFEALVHYLSRLEAELAERLSRPPFVLAVRGRTPGAWRFRDQ
jgi:hypothetical protein